MLVTSIFSLPHNVCVLSKRNFNFSVTFILSPANAFELDQSKILLFCKELKSTFLYHLFQNMMWFNIKGDNESPVIICLFPNYCYVYNLCYLKHLIQKKKIDPCRPAQDTKHCGKRRKCWLPAFSPFLSVVFKVIIPQGCQSILR